MGNRKEGGHEDKARDGIWKLQEIIVIKDENLDTD